MKKRQTESEISNINPLQMEGLPPETRTDSFDIVNKIFESENSPADPAVNDDFEFFIPIHGFIRFSREELAVINHPAFQRLGEIYQLGQSYLVYRGATHRRLEHVLGTVHVAQEMMNAVEQTYSCRLRAGTADSDSNCTLGKPFSICERAFIRLAALLHDIGHLSCGHTLEDELGLLDKHDDPPRINLVLDRPDWPAGAKRTLRQIVDDEYKKFLDGALVSASRIAVAIICKHEKLSAKQPGSLRVSVCRDVVGNTICADILDYLHRDWWHIGKPRYFDKRLFQYMEIREQPAEGAKFVISLGDSERIKTDAISLIIDLLESRYQLAEAVLFHRTKCSASAMLERAVQEIYEKAIASGTKPEDWKKNTELGLLDCSDASVFDYLLEQAKAYKADAAITIIRDLQGRRIFRQAFTFRYGSSPIKGNRLQRLYTFDKKDVDRNETRAPSQRRLSLVRMLEEDFLLPSGSVAVYCPSKSMNAKIAEVNLHVDNDIAPFNAWASSDKTLGSGHIEAQTARFQRLWRVHVCVSREIWDAFSIAERDLFRQMTEGLALCLTKRQQIGLARELAQKALKLESGRFVKYEFQEAARRTGLEQYPSTAPRLSNFLKIKDNGGKT